MGEAGNGFSDDVEMLAGLQRYIDTRHAPHFMGPHACTIDHHIAGNRARIVRTIAAPGHAGRATVFHGDVGDLDAFKHRCAILACTFGKRERDVGGIALTVPFQIDRTGHVIGIEMRIAIFDIGC